MIGLFEHQEGTCKANITAATAGSSNFPGALREPHGVQNYFPVPALPVCAPASTQDTLRGGGNSEEAAMPCSRSHCGIVDGNE